MRLIRICYALFIPARNRTKQYLENSYYHIYNRGVEKRLIFMDEQDYGVFLSYLKEYLSFRDEAELSNKFSNPDTSYKEKDRILRVLKLNNFYGEITLIAYCLMPNHFHFFIKQKGHQSIDKFMQSLATRYVMYFNRKHKRVGALFQDIYKAVTIDNDQQFIYLSKYIHKQAVLHNLRTKGSTLRAYNHMFSHPSSYLEYLGERKTEWVHPEEVLAFFSKTNPKLSYQNFVEESDDFSPIKKQILEEDL